MNTSADEREEIEALLPWFVTNKLGAAERQRVERYIAQHPDMARQVAIIREESAETVAGAEMLGMPSRASFERLMAQIEGQPAKQAGIVQSFVPLLEQVADWIAGFSRLQVGALAAAAALLVAVQAAGLVYFVAGSADNRTYQTASGPSDVATRQGTFALVAFKPGATAAEIAAALSEAGAQVVEGPRAGGLWRLQLAAEPLAQADAEARVALLRSKSAIISFVSLTQ